MGRPTLVFETVDFGFDGSGLLMQSLTLHLDAGWTGIVGANGAGKTTLLGLATGQLLPSRGVVRVPSRVEVCEQRTDAPSETVLAFARSDDGAAGRWRGRLGVDGDAVWRWPALSHGERKRLQVAAALWRQPDLLALDEPTNHLDTLTTDLVREALSGFRGIGLLVSHDRTLLDALCSRTVAAHAEGWRLFDLRPSAARAALDGEARDAKRARELADADVARLARAARQRADAVAQADRRLSKRHLPRRDRDARARIDAARLSGKDARAGRLLRQVQQRVDQARTRATDLVVPREFRVGITMPARRSERRVLASVGPAQLPLGPERALRIPRVLLGASDRVRITGPNGSGKSTFMRALVEALVGAGRPLVYVPQEFTSEEGRALLGEVRARPPAERGRLMTIVRRLGSDPHRLLASAMPSPGEVRKLALARGLEEGIEAILLDEPTNHLDLPSIEAVEQALAEATCALVIVSHDVAFSTRLATSTWTTDDDVLSCEG